MQHTKMFGTLILFSGLLSACSPWGCVKGSGEPIKSTVVLDAFSGIVVDGSMDVRLMRSPVREVKVEGQPNLIELVDLIVQNGTLHVSTSKCYKSPYPFVVHVALPSVESLTVHGSGSVHGTGPFTLPNLTVEVMGSGAVHMQVDARRITALVQGSGDVLLNGSCGALSSTVQGSGTINADAMTCSTAVAKLKGSGSITVQATDKLEAEIDGSGTIRYRGEPVILQQQVNGSGSIIPVQ